MHPLKSFLYLTGICTLLSGCGASKPRGYTYSSTTDFYDGARFEEKTLSTVWSLYTFVPQRELVGNPCVTEFTRPLGFEYVYPFTTPGLRPNRLHAFFHNSYYKIRLTLRHGFKWSRETKARIKQCKTSSGDFTG